MSEAHSILSLPEEAFRWYFTGLVDGEGCFRISPATARTRRPWQVHFSISLRADDGANLAAVACRMGCGRLYFKKPQKPHPGGFLNSKAALAWNVNRIDDHANIIVPHFDRYPLQFKKAKDFAIWRQAIALLHSATKRGKKGLPRGTKLITPEEDAMLAFLDAELKQLRRYDENIAGALMAIVKRPL